MLTSLYSILAILESLLFGDFGSLSDWYRQRSLLLGILGRLAQAKRIPLSVPEVAKVFGYDSGLLSSSNTSAPPYTKKTESAL